MTQPDAQVESDPFQMLARFTSAILAFSLAGFWVLSSYFDIDPFELSVFSGSDGNCRTPADAVGHHCFGDYRVLAPDGLFGPPSSAEAVYTPLSRIALIPTKVLELVGGPRVGVLVSLLLIAAAMNAAFSRLANTRDLSFAVGRISLIGILSIPVIAILDRFNSLWWSYLLLMFAILYRSRAYIPQVLIGLGALVKPALIVFLLPHLAYRLSLGHRFRSSVLTSLITAFSVGVLTIAVFAWSGWAHDWTFAKWLTSVSEWSGAQSGSKYPADVSFGRLLESSVLIRLLSLVLILASAIIAILLVWTRSAGFSSGHRRGSSSDKWLMDACDAELAASLALTTVVLSLMQRPFWIYNLSLFLPVIALVAKRAPRREGRDTRYTATSLKVRPESNLNSGISVGSNDHEERSHTLQHHERMVDRLMVLMGGTAVVIVAPIVVPNWSSFDRLRLAEQSDLSTYNIYDIYVRPIGMFFLIVFSLLILTLQLRNEKDIHRSFARLDTIE